MYCVIDVYILLFEVFNVLMYAVSSFCIYCNGGIKS